MTDVAILCPKCGERLTVPEAADGKKGRCPCGAVFEIDLAHMEAPAAAPGRRMSRPPAAYGPPEGTLVEIGMHGDQIVHLMGNNFEPVEPGGDVLLLCYYELGIAFRLAAGALHSVYLYAKNPYGYDNYLGVIYRGLSTQSTQGDISVVLGEPEETRALGGDKVLAPQLEMAYPSMGLTFSVRGTNPLDSSARVRHVVVTRPIHLMAAPPVAMQ
jgi:hypothetical protein